MLRSDGVAMAFGDTPDSFMMGQADIPELPPSMKYIIGPRVVFQATLVGNSMGFVTVAGELLDISSPVTPAGGLLDPVETLFQLKAKYPLKEVDVIMPSGQLLSSGTVASAYYHF